LVEALVAELNGVGVHPYYRERTARNAEIYERHVLGETQSSLANEFDITPGRIYAIVKSEEARRRRSGQPWGDRLIRAWARAAYLEDLEPIE
jgi:Mor family transcriptional regulator